MVQKGPCRQQSRLSIPECQKAFTQALAGEGRWKGGVPLLMIVKHERFHLHGQAFPFSSLMDRKEHSRVCAGGQLAADPAGTFRFRGYWGRSSCGLQRLPTSPHVSQSTTCSLSTFPPPPSKFLVLDIHAVRAGLSLRHCSCELFPALVRWPPLCFLASPLLAPWAKSKATGRIPDTPSEVSLTRY